VQLEDVVTRDLWLVLHAELQHQARVRAVTEFVVREVAGAKPALAGR
jgi:hypothetical protein